LNKAGFGNEWLAEKSPLFLFWQITDVFYKGKLFKVKSEK